MCQPASWQGLGAQQLGTRPCRGSRTGATCCGRGRVQGRGQARASGARGDPSSPCSCRDLPAWLPVETEVSQVASSPWGQGRTPLQSLRPSWGLGWPAQSQQVLQSPPARQQPQSLGGQAGALGVWRGWGQPRPGHCACPSGKRLATSIDFDPSGSPIKTATRSPFASCICLFRAGPAHS